MVCDSGCFNPNPGRSGITFHSRDNFASGTALADFSGEEYGPQHLTFAKGDVILWSTNRTVWGYAWSYGLHLKSNKAGWYPDHFMVYEC